MNSGSINDTVEMINKLYVCSLVSKQDDRGVVVFGHPDNHAILYRRHASPEGKNRKI